MKKSIFFLFVFGFFVNAYSQEALWTDAYYSDDFIFYNAPIIHPESEETFLVEGRVINSITQQIMLHVLKYDISGNLISEQTFDNELSNYSIIDYKIDNLGHVYMLIFKEGKIVVRKYTLNNGDVIWTKTIQAAENYSYYPISLIISENNTIFITAERYVSSTYNSDTARLFAYDTEGNQLWERVFDSSNQLAGDNVLAHLVYNNEIYLTGFTNGSNQVKLIKVDSYNNITLNTFTDIPYYEFNVKRTQDNKLLIINKFVYQFSKMDLDGNILWSVDNPFPNDTTSSGAGSVIQDEQGNFYIDGHYRLDELLYGFSNSHNLILKLDNNGNLLWQNVFPYALGGALVLKNGNLFVGTSEIVGHEAYDYLVYKINPQTGNTNGVYRYEAAGGEEGLLTSIYVFDDNKVALTGRGLAFYVVSENKWITQLLSESSFSVENPDNLENVKLYPNPLDENQLLMIEAENLKSYTVYSLTGQLLQQGKFESGSVHSIQLHSLTKGVYLLKLNNDRQTLTKKIVIR
jgi:hypothetical protein